MHSKNRSSRNRLYYQKNKERLKQRQAAYYRRTREKRLKWQKEYGKRNRKIRLKYNRKYYKKNRVLMKEKATSRYRKNRASILAKIRIYRKTSAYKARFADWKRRYFADPRNRKRKQRSTQEWISKNYERYLASRRAYEKRMMADPNYREKRRQQKATYMRERAKRDPAFRLRLRHSRRVTDAYRRQNLSKPHSADLLIGCSWEKFRAHVRAKYRDGMTDQNYGKVWELDHIRPCSSFDLRKPSHVKRCFNYQNYQPLLVSENRQKSDKGRRRKLSRLA